MEILLKQRVSAFASLASNEQLLSRTLQDSLTNRSVLDMKHASMLTLLQAELLALLTRNRSNSLEELLVAILAHKSFRVAQGPSHRCVYAVGLKVGVTPPCAGGWGAQKI